MVENEIYIAVTVWNPRTKPINKKPTLILLQRNPANFKFHFTEVWKIYWKLRLAKIKLSRFSPNINYWERQLKINSFFRYSCKICIRSKSMLYGWNKKWLTFLRDFSPKKQSIVYFHWVTMCIYAYMNYYHQNAQLPTGWLLYWRVQKTLASRWVFGLWQHRGIALQPNHNFLIISDR